MVRVGIGERQGELHAEDRAHASGFTRQRKLHGPTQVQVIGQRDRGHARLRGGLNQTGRVGQTLQQREAGVHVQVCEVSQAMLPL